MRKYTTTTDTAENLILEQLRDASVIGTGIPQSGRSEERVETIHYLLIVSLLLLSGCGYGGQSMDGEIVTENAPQNSAPPVTGTAGVSYESFDGGGPEFSVRIDDPEIASCESRRHYWKDDHEQMTGAGYQVTFTFTALKAGETTATISARSPIAENFDAVYAIKVDGAGGITLELLEES